MSKPSFPTKSILGQFISQLFRDEAFKLRTGLLKKTPKTPWMRSREIDFVVDLLTQLKPMNSVEYGAGYSSEFFSNYLPKGFSWHSIEHHKEWSETAKKLVTKSGIHIHHVPSNAPEKVYSYPENDGTYQDFKDYVDFPSQFAPFDFIFIDGRARIACIEKAKSMLSENGVVLVHDANRSQYQIKYSDFKHSYFFEDNRETSGGIWIGSNGNKPLTELIDIEMYTKLWAFYHKFGKIIKV